MQTNRTVSPARAICTVTVAIAVALLSAADVIAHGGAYRGPGGGIGPGGRGGSGGSTGRSQGGVSGVSVERWELWWAFNREDFLWSSGYRRNRARTTGGEQAVALEKRVREDLIPLLEKALKSRDTDLRDTAAFVLGKTGAPEKAIPLLAAARSDRVESVVESVALGLGSLRHPDGIEPLVELLKSPKTKSRTRAYAALALGFIGTDEAYDVLRAGVGFTKKRSRPLAIRNLDIDSFRVIGMGLTRTPEARRHLIHLAETSEGRDSLEMILPLALQRTEDPDAVPSIVPLLANRNVHVRRSAAIALGRLAGPNAAEVVKRLQYAFLEDSDNSVKNFAAISLGRIGTADAVTFLQKNFEKTTSLTRAFVDLALGIAGDPDAGPLLEKSFAESSEQSFRGALALALGILGYEEAAPRLEAALVREKSDTLRGHLVLALGLMNHDSVAPIAEHIVAEERDAGLRGEAAETLALLGKDSTVPLLVGLLERDESIYITSAVAAALGRLRTAASFDALLELAGNERANPRVRAFALTALGRIVDPNIPPVLARVVGDHNYRLQIGPIYDLLGLL